MSPIIVLLYRYTDKQMVMTDTENPQRAEGLQISRFILQKKHKCTYLKLVRRKFYPFHFSGNSQSLEYKQREVSWPVAQDVIQTVVGCSAFLQGNTTIVDVTTNFVRST